MYAKEELLILLTVSQLNLQLQLLNTVAFTVHP